MAVTLEAIKDIIKKLQEELQDKYDSKIIAIARESDIRYDQLTKKCDQIEKRLEDKMVVEHKENIVTPNLEINCPKYYGNNRDFHPKVYLQKIELYFRRRGINEGDKLLIVEESMKGNAANWYSIVSYLCCDYENFKVLFLEQFWSREIQLSIWSQFTTASRITDVRSYREYFGNWIQRVRYLDAPKLSESETINIIARHFPGYIQAISVSMPNKTYLEATNLLGREDAYRTQNDIKNTQNNTNDQYANKNTDMENKHSNNTFYRNKPYTQRNATDNGGPSGEGKSDNYKTRYENKNDNRNNTRYNVKKYR